MVDLSSLSPEVISVLGIETKREGGGGWKNKIKIKIKNWIPPLTIKKRNFRTRIGSRLNQ